MPDILVRDLTDEVVAALDARAAQLGLSRSEFLRRRLTQEAAATGPATSLADLERFSTTFADLADPTIMRGAWD